MKKECVVYAIPTAYVYFEYHSKWSALRSNYYNNLSWPSVNTYIVIFEHKDNKKFSSLSVSCLQNVRTESWTLLYVLLNEITLNIPDIYITNFALTVLYGI